MRKLTLIAMAALLLVCTQCKKNNDTQSSKTVEITFAASGNDTKSSFDPALMSFAWNTEGFEYIYVGGSNQGYLGRLESFGEVDAEGYLSFHGEITEPQAGETLHFFYLGNGQDSEEAVNAMDFSAQDGTLENVTNYHVAVVSIEANPENNYRGILKSLVSFAYINLAAFMDANDAKEVVYLHGAGIYNAAEVDYAGGTLVPVEETGYINLGRADEGYYALIPQVEHHRFTAKFDSNTKTGTVEFVSGVRPARYYSNDDYTALVPVMGELRENAGGLFAVSDTKLVRFAKTNLQCDRANADAEWAPENLVWSFMENPWDVFENGTVSENYADETKVSLFGWGTSGYWAGINSGYGQYSLPYCTFNDDDDNAGYGPVGNTHDLTGDFANADWGIYNNDQLGGENPAWRVLTKNEWTYLFGREYAYGRGKYLVNAVNYRGVIIVPNDFNDPIANNAQEDGFSYGDATTFDGSNVFAEDRIEKMDNAGAVFLPVAGYRSGTTVNFPTAAAHYWSSTCQRNTYNAYCLRVTSTQCNPAFGAFTRSTGMNVRLVMDID